MKTPVATSEFSEVFTGVMPKDDGSGNPYRLGLAGRGSWFISPRCPLQPFLVYRLRSSILLILPVASFGSSLAKITCLGFL